MRGHHPITHDSKIKKNICFQNKFSENILSIKIYIIHMYLLVEGLLKFKEYV